MKVSGTNGVGSTGGPRQTRPAGGGEGFRLGSPAAAAGPAQTAPATGVTGVASVDALLALQQDVGGPLERKRRAVGRAGRILDVLDGVKDALLAGELGLGDLDRLKRAIKEERAATDDPQLEGLLDEIETRAAVELAKIERSAADAS